jgi:plastocyanin
MPEDNTFSPDTVSVKTGDVVEWNDKLNFPHNVTFTDAVARSLNSSLLGQSPASGQYPKIWQVKFTKAGDYPYICTLHKPGMTGTVHVSG